MILQAERCITNFNILIPSPIAFNFLLGHDVWEKNPNNKKIFHQGMIFVKKSHGRK